jgi:hypothetical protein
MAYILDLENQGAWDLLAGNQQQQVTTWLSAYRGENILE